MLIDASQKEDGLCSQHLIGTTNATAAAAAAVEESAAKLDFAELDLVDLDSAELDLVELGPAEAEPADDSEDISIVVLETLATDSSPATAADFALLEVAAVAVAAAFEIYSMLVAHSELKLAYGNALIVLRSINKGSGKGFR